MMDQVVSAALQEVSLEGAEGCPLSKLWVQLQAVTAASSMLLAGRGKQLVWQELLKVPGLNLLFPNSSSLACTDPKVQSVGKAEKLGLHLVAPEALRDTVLGLYDFKECDARLSKEQRKILERVAKSRIKGVTQSQLAKEFKAGGNKIFYLVRVLESRGLVVRQATIIRTESSKSFHPIVATNLVHLTRFAKERILSSHQRFEILDSLKDAHVKTADSCNDDPDGEEVANLSKEREFMVTDDLPAMRNVCEKLEVAQGKVLVVSDLKVTLGYRFATGHRTWRRLAKRLQDAGLVQVFNGNVNTKVVSCIRLIKSFDVKAFNGSNEEAESESLPKGVKRGQVTELITELPIDHQIYDLISKSGSDGLYTMEVWKRLGLNNKRNYYRITNMLAKQCLLSEAENHKRSTLYRLRTAQNSGRTSGTVDTTLNMDLACMRPSENATHESLCKNSMEERLPANQSVSLPIVPVGAQGTVQTSSQVRKKKRKEGPLQASTVVLASRLANENASSLATAFTGLSRESGCTNVRLSVYTGTCTRPPLSSGAGQQLSSVPITTTSIQREQRIMERLQDEGFIIRVVLHRWLEGLENRKDTMMDRKTLTRLLQKLQRKGLCKCVIVNMPGLTNCGRQRIVEVVLLPSVEVHADLLSKVHDGMRKFDMECRGQGLSRVKMQDTAPILTGVTRMTTTAHRSTKTVSDQATEKVQIPMQRNGFIPAKMVRVRLLHYFLCTYVNSLPATDTMTVDGQGHPGEMVGTCKVFGLVNAIHAMPLEVFLQVVGCTYEIPHLTEKCKQGLRLCDLPKEEYIRFLDANATGRLSWIIDVLRRLKLVRLVMGHPPPGHSDKQDLEKSSISAFLTYAVEGEPFLEEPAPWPLSSLSLDNYNIAPRSRHLFNISNVEGLDAFWQTLEYFFAGAQPEVARHAFPGSNVPELFGLRSWTSTWIMNIEQRTELLRRIGAGGIAKRISYKESVAIAKELDLSLEQVLKFSHEKNRVSRLQAAQKDGLTAKKQTVSGVGLSEPSHVRAYKRGMLSRSDTFNECVSTSAGHDDRKLVTLQEANIVDFEDDNDENEDDNGKESDMLLVGNLKPSRRRLKRYIWSGNTERRLILCYCRQRAILGAVFNRVDWSTVQGLPAPPQACRRRVAHLRSDPSVRKAMTCLCSLLADRYGKHVYLKESKFTNPPNRVPPEVQVETSQSKGSDCSSPSNFHDGLDKLEGSCLVTGENFCWDNVEEPCIAAAIDEVMRCKHFSKSYPNKRGGTAGLIKAKGFPDVIFTPVRGSCITQSCSADDSLVSLQETPGAGCTDPSGSSLLDSINIFGAKDFSPPDGVSLKRARNIIGSRLCPGAGPSRRVKKKLPKGLQKPLPEAYANENVCKSIGVANAVELVKLILLNNPSESQLPCALIDAVQRCKEADIFIAVKYLREHGFLISGQNGQTLELSSSFLHNCSASPYPLETGSECRRTEQWLEEHMRHVEEDGLLIPGSQQAGQVSHLLALVASGEYLLTPVLPDHGIGESEQSKVASSLGKRKPDTFGEGENARYVRSKSQSVYDSLLAVRRERGFSGIGVSLKYNIRPISQMLNMFYNTSFTSPELQLGIFHPPASPSRVLSSSSSLITVEEAFSEQGQIRVVQCGSTVSQISEKPCCLVELSRTAEGQQSSAQSFLPSLAKCQAGSNRDLTIENITLNVPALASCVKYWVPPLNSQLLQGAYCAIHGAGDKGLSLLELSESMFSLEISAEKKIVDTYVHALEAFELVRKVNAYDHVRVLVWSVSTRFYLHIRSKDCSNGTGMSHTANYRSIISLPHDMNGSHGRTIPFSTHGVNFDMSGNIVNADDLQCTSGGRGAEMRPKLWTELSTANAPVTMKSGEHRVIEFSRARDVDFNVEYVPIVPWLTGAGTPHLAMLKALTRRVIGIIMLSPGIAEDSIVEQMDVLNPQNALHLLNLLELDGHLYTRSVCQNESAYPPKLLFGLVKVQVKQKLTRHYFVNPLSGVLL